MTARRRTALVIFDSLLLGGACVEDAASDSPDDAPGPTAEPAARSQKPFIFEKNRSTILTRSIDLAGEIAMPVPVLALIVVGVVSLLVGSTIAKWDDIVVALKGKRVAVLGARGVGKTHLIKFLTSGSIPAEYKQTVAPEKASARRFQLRDLDLKVKDTLDVSGDKAAYAEWKDLHDHADVVLYLLRADRLLAGDVDVETRVRDDLRHIGGWLEARAARPRFFIIGTHCDLDDQFAGLSADKIGDYVDRFRNLPIVSELVARSGGAQQAKVVLGSMKAVEGTEALVYQIFTQVMT